VVVFEVLDEVFTGVTADATEREKKRRAQRDGRENALGHDWLFLCKNKRFAVFAAVTGNRRNFCTRFMINRKKTNQKTGRTHTSRHNEHNSFITS
jgi:hypothetical protein